MDALLPNGSQTLPKNAMAHHCTKGDTRDYSKKCLKITFNIRNWELLNEDFNVNYLVILTSTVFKFQLYLTYGFKLTMSCYKGKKKLILVKL